MAIIPDSITHYTGIDARPAPIEALVRVLPQVQADSLCRWTIGPGVEQCRGIGYRIVRNKKLQKKTTTFSQTKRVCKEPSVTLILPFLFSTAAL